MNLTERDIQQIRFFATDEQMAKIMWTSMDEPPTTRDVDDTGFVVFTDGKNEWEAEWSKPMDATHWRKIILP